MSILDRVRARPGASPANQSSKAKAKAPVHPPSESSPQAPETQRRSFSMSSKTSDKSSASTRLSIAGVVNIFLRLRQLERTTKKIPPITCSSGESPISHPRVAANVVADANKVPLSREEVYTCAGNGGINTLQLIRATRNSLLRVAKDIGANILVDEKWTCTIHEPKQRQRGHFKVHVKYDACATRSPSACECPQPVAVDRIVNVPGLMTIIRRVED